MSEAGSILLLNHASYNIIFFKKINIWDAEQIIKWLF